MSHINSLNFNTIDEDNMETRFETGLSFSNFYKKYNKILSGGSLENIGGGTDSDNTIGTINTDEEDLMNNDEQPVELSAEDQVETLVNFVRMMGGFVPIANIMLPDKDKIIKKAIKLKLVKKDGDNLIINNDKLKIEGGKLEKRKSKDKENIKQNRRKSKRKSKKNNF